MLLPKLDERLQTAYDLFPTCEWAADVGCDHGRLPLHLLAADKAERMIVSDISPQALAKGKELISRWGEDVGLCAAALDGETEPAEEILSSGECLFLKDLAVSGGDFPHLHGKEVGALLEHLLQHVLRHPDDNVRQVLLELARKM